MNINKESRDTKKIGQTPFASPTSTFPSAAMVPFMLLTFLSHLRYRAWAANTSSESVLAYERSAQGKRRTALADMLAASTAACHLPQPLPGFCLMHEWASPVTELLIRSGPHSLVIRNFSLEGVLHMKVQTDEQYGKNFLRAFIQEKKMLVKRKNKAGRRERGRGWRENRSRSAV